jgi:hypothetical protein
MSTEPSSKNLEAVLEDLRDRAAVIREEVTDPLMDCEGPSVAGAPVAAGTRSTSMHEQRAEGGA